MTAGPRFLRARTWPLVVATTSAVTASLVVVGAAWAIDRESAAGATTTVAATTTVPATTVPATTTTTAPPPPLPPPADEASDPVGALVPSIVAYSEALDSGDERQAAISAALTDRTNAVATDAQPETLCAAVPVAAPLMAAGRWELDGEPLATSPELRRDPPGYGDCLDGEEFDGFDDGVYQYVAVGPTGARSAAVTFVLGVPSVPVWLLNDGEQPVCLVQASPGPADFYESYAADSQLLPGEALAIRLAAVDHDVRVFGCPPDDVVRSFDLEPQFGVYVDLFGSDEPEGSTPPTAPAGSATSTTARPTTTG
jgi:hypothetical protein